MAGAFPVARLALPGLRAVMRPSENVRTRFAFRDERAAPSLASPSATGRDFTFGAGRLRGFGVSVLLLPASTPFILASHAADGERRSGENERLRWSCSAIPELRAG